MFIEVARNLWTWRWREETRVIPYASDLDTADQPQAGQPEHVGPAKSSLSYAFHLEANLKAKCYIIENFEHAQGVF